MYLDIIKNINLTQDIWEMQLAGSFPWAEFKPGQFLNILIGEGLTHVLRRPISIAALDYDSHILTIVFRVVGEGTAWLSERKVGEKLDVLGPIGQGFPLPPPDSRTLIVGGGIGSPPLYGFAQSLAAAGHKPSMVLGFRNESECFWQEKFAALGDLSISTEDGSLGKQGYVTDVLADLDSIWDYVYACGPKAMLQSLRDYFTGQPVAGYVSLEERMACGVGACYGCTCLRPDHQKTHRVCVDGPVFSWSEVDLREA